MVASKIGDVGTDAPTGAIVDGGGTSGRMELHDPWRQGGSL